MVCACDRARFQTILAVTYVSANVVSRFSLAVIFCGAQSFLSEPNDLGKRPMRLTRPASTIYPPLRIREAYEARLTRSWIGANEDKYRCTYRKSVLRDTRISTRIPFTLVRKMSLRDKRFAVSYLSEAPRAIDFFKDARLPRMCRSQSSDDAQCNDDERAACKPKGIVNPARLLRDVLQFLSLSRVLCAFCLSNDVSSGAAQHYSPSAYSIDGDDDKGGAERKRLCLPS